MTTVTTTKATIATAKTTIATAKMMIAIAMTPWHQEGPYRKRIIKEYHAVLLLSNWLHCIMMTKYKCQNAGIFRLLLDNWISPASAFRHQVSPIPLVMD
jgi:hypothetical protein